MPMTDEQKERNKKYWREVWYPKNRAKHVAHNMEYSKKKRVRVREMLAEIKVKGGCTDCGYNKDAIALDFDHISDDKLFDVSTAGVRGYGVPRIMAEVGGCEIVCSNCHRIRTRDRFVGAKGSR